MVNVRYCECGRQLDKLAKKYCPECAVIYRKIALKRASEKQRITRYCECGRQLDKNAKKFCSECSVIYRQISQDISLSKRYGTHKKNVYKNYHENKITREMIREDIKNEKFRQDKNDDFRRRLRHFQ